MQYANWPLFVRKKYWLSHLELRSPDDAVTHTASAETAIKWLYDLLTMLDTKASALMRLNGVLIAAAAFLLGVVGRPGTTILATDAADSRLIICCALLSALSIFACLFVVNVSWPFLGLTTLDDKTVDCSEEIRSLDAACTWRRRMYRAAWTLSLVASFLFLLEFAHQAWNVFKVT
jgi:hypothetical protein